MVELYHRYAFYDFYSAEPSLFPNALPALATGHPVAGGTTGVTSLTLATAYGYALLSRRSDRNAQRAGRDTSSAASASATKLSIHSINVSSGMGWPTGYWLSPTFTPSTSPMMRPSVSSCHYNNLAWVGLVLIALQYAASEGTLWLKGSWRTRT